MRMRGMCSRSARSDIVTGPESASSPLDWSASQPVCPCNGRARDARTMRSAQGPNRHVRCSAVSEKSLFIQGILLTQSFLLKSVESIVHVLDEWAKVAPDTSGAHSGRSDWLSKTTRIRLPSGYADNLALARSMGRRNDDLGGVKSLPSFVIIAQAPIRLGPGIADHIDAEKGRHGTARPIVRPHRP